MHESKSRRICRLCLVFGTRPTQSSFRDIHPKVGSTLFVRCGIFKKYQPEAHGVCHPQKQRRNFLHFGPIEETGIEFLMFAPHTLGELTEAANHMCVLYGVSGRIVLFTGKKDLKPTTSFTSCSHTSSCGRKFLSFSFSSRIFFSAGGTFSRKDDSEHHTKMDEEANVERRKHVDRSDLSRRRACESDWISENRLTSLCREKRQTSQFDQQHVISKNRTKHMNPPDDGFAHLQKR